MDYLISFAVSVMANIAAYIVTKWIDKQSHDKIKMSLYSNTATFFGAADRIRTCGLSGRSSQTHRAKRLCEAVFRRLCTKFKTIQNAREAFSEPASRAFAYVVVKWWSQ